MRNWRWPWAWEQSRTVLLFLGGMLGIAHQELFVDQEKYTLLILYAGMIGLGGLLHHEKPSKKETPAPPPDAGEEP